MTGCGIPLQGSGEIGIGYDQARGRVFVYHTTDKELTEATSKSTLDLQPLMDWLIEWERLKQAGEAAQRSEGVVIEAEVETTDDRP